METTCRIDSEVLFLLKQLQMDLLRKGVRVKQKELISAMADISIRHENELLEKFLHNPEKDYIKEMLAHPFKDGPKTNAVKDHDLVF